jgi:mannitol/fructose-specific phosphotransferase system IIA component (Ntr-type)
MKIGETMAMKLTHYMRPEAFLPSLAEKSRDEALHRILHTAAENGLVKDESELYEKLIEREKMQSTAVGNGIAVPHCFTDEISDLIIIVARAPAGLDFGSFDGKPTQVVCLFIGNSNEHGLHLYAFARIARLIKRPAFIEKIVSSTSAQDMVRVFSEEEAKIS